MHDAETIGKNGIFVEEPALEEADPVGEVAAAVLVVAPPVAVPAEEDAVAVAAAVASCAEVAAEQ